MKAFGRLAISLQGRQHGILLALLAVLHLTLLAGVDTAVGLMCWLGDVGLFILWQPFIQTRRPLGVEALIWLALVLAGGVALFGWWLLILWVVVLTALLGGRLFRLEHRPTRIFHLLAFAYLVAVLLVFLVPKVVPGGALNGPSLDQAFLRVALLLFVAMCLIPRQAAGRQPGGRVIDFFYSLFIFLLISVLVLGSLAFMLIRQSSYLEAVFNTLLSLAAMLLLMAWAWSPRRGFGGVGILLSRYLLTVGMPFDTWLKRLMALARRESDPDLFIAQVGQRLLEQHWVCGFGWKLSPGAEMEQGFVGEKSRFPQAFDCPPLLMTLYTAQPLSPSLVWHFNLLARLTKEYYETKRRARELQQMGYLRAVHETGARLTHDIKNLLQSLNNICYLTQQAGDGDEARLNQLLRRQLPQITQRLQQTLGKLQMPTSPLVAGCKAVERISASEWWQGLQQRYADEALLFAAVAFSPEARVPVQLFDSAIDNLIQNALLKRRETAGLTVRVALSADASQLCVCDDGCPVSEDIVGQLLRAPVRSENGLGIGLYQAARQAEGGGYELRLARNLPGEVCFELRRRPAG